MLCQMGKRAMEALLSVSGMGRVCCYFTVPKSIL